jgi:hypothetical protein
VGFVWFRHDKRHEGESNWRLDSDPESLAAFRRWTVEQLDEADSSR